MRTQKGKGTRAENDLQRLLHSYNFATARIANHEINNIKTPDVLAFKNGQALAFECKAHDSFNLSIDKTQILSELDWCSKARIPLILAWKISSQDWLFILPYYLKTSEKTKSINRHKAYDSTLTLIDLDNLIRGIKP